MDLLLDTHVFLWFIEVDHLRVLLALPFHHRDPFDRLLAAQSTAEGLALIRMDTIFDAYGIDRFW